MEKFEIKRKEIINTDEASERWKSMLGGEKQYWLGKFYSVNEENKREFVGKILRAKHGTFEQLDDELAGYIAREAWGVEVEK